MAWAKENGATPLFVACQQGHVDAARLLLEKGAEVDQAMNDGSTPLWMACHQGHVDVATLLLDKGAEVDRAENKYGATPLFIACQQGHVDVATLLLEKGAEVDKANNNRATPLWTACNYGHADVAQLLLNHGAEIDRAKKGGYTPLSIAKHQCHSSIVALLEEKKKQREAAAAAEIKKLREQLKKGKEAMQKLSDDVAQMWGRKCESQSGGGEKLSMASMSLFDAVDRLPPPPKVLVHESWYDDTAAHAVALEAKLTEHQKELRRLKCLLAERDTDALECPITREIYEDPVIAADGFSYERREIENWFARGKRTSPKTNAELKHLDLVPNHDLKSACQVLLDEVRQFEASSGDVVAS